MTCIYLLDSARGSDNNMSYPRSNSQKLKKDTKGSELHNVKFHLYFVKYFTTGNYFDKFWEKMLSVVTILHKK